MCFLTSTAPEGALRLLFARCDGHWGWISSGTASGDQGRCLCLSDRVRGSQYQRALLLCYSAGKLWVWKLLLMFLWISYSKITELWAFGFCVCKFVLVCLCVFPSERNNLTSSISFCNRVFESWWFCISWLRCSCISQLCIQPRGNIPVLGVLCCLAFTSLFFLFATLSNRDIYVTYLNCYFCLCYLKPNKITSL